MSGKIQLRLQTALWIGAGGCLLFLLELALHPRVPFWPAPEAAPDERPAKTAGDPSYTIRITEEQIQELLVEYARNRETSPHPMFEAAAVEEHINNEILAREARRLGLDRDDPLVRVILAEKMAQRLNANPLPPEPDEAVLRSLYEATLDEYRFPDEVTLRQVFFNEGRFPGDATKALVLLQRGHSHEVVAENADAPPGGPVLRGRTRERLAELFGERFARAAFSLPVGKWHRVRSLQGTHLITVLERNLDRVVPFEEARPRVLNGWQRQWLRENRSESVRDLRKKYEIVGWPR